MVDAFSAFLSVSLGLLWLLTQAGEGEDEGPAHPFGPRQPAMLPFSISSTATVTSHSVLVRDAAGGQPLSRGEGGWR